MHMDTWIHQQTSRRIGRIARMTGRRGCACVCMCVGVCVVGVHVYVCVCVMTTYEPSCHGVRVCVRVCVCVCVCIVCVGIEYIARMTLRLV